MISVDEFIRLETCIHGWWSCRLFLLLADGLNCRLLWDDILVDQSLPETALSLTMDIRLFLFVAHFLRRRHLLMCMRKVD